LIAAHPHQSSGHIVTIDLARGILAIAVMVYHLLAFEHLALLPV
jgi:peptidoglycan/LPS O-acetylase OafA/YrhL